MAAENFLKKAGTQSLGAYIDRIQETVTEWVPLRPILEVCDRDTGYEVERRLQEPCWRQTAARKQLSAMFKEILVAAREWRWKSGRRDGGGGYRNIEESDDCAGSNVSQYFGTDTVDS